MPINAPDRTLASIPALPMVRGAAEQCAYRRPHEAAHARGGPRPDGRPGARRRAPRARGGRYGGSAEGRPASRDSPPETPGATAVSLHWMW